MCPFAWFGIQTEAAPSCKELIYTLHPQGFALVSTRSPSLQRMCFQCDPHENTANWFDVRTLSRALSDFYASANTALLDQYSATCLRRIWKAQRFSWWMTTLLHCDDQASPFDKRRQLAELDYVTRSRAAATSLAENYVGLPME